MGKNLINVALFGLGRIGLMHANNLTNNKNFNLKYIFDVNKKLAKKVSKNLNCQNIESPQIAYRDKKIDLLLNFLDEQSFIPRLTILIYTKEDYCYKDCYSKKQRYFYLEKNLENKYKFERVIFQRQDNNKLGIVVHSKNIDFIDSYLNSKDLDLFKQIIISHFNELFEDNPCINQLTFNEQISIMRWRASQPSGCTVPLSLQFNRKYRIGFCGDWFEGEGFGRIEGSIMSSLKLAIKFKNLN